MIEPIITKGITYSLSEHLTWIACCMLLHAPLRIRYRYARNPLKTSQASPASVLANAHIGSPRKPVPIRLWVKTFSFRTTVLTWDTKLRCCSQNMTGNLVLPTISKFCTSKFHSSILFWRVRNIIGLVVFRFKIYLLEIGDHGRYWTEFQLGQHNFEFRSASPCLTSIHRAMKWRCLVPSW